MTSVPQLTPIACLPPRSDDTPSMQTTKSQSIHAFDAMPFESSKNNRNNYEQVGELVSIFKRGDQWYVYYRLDGKPYRQSLKTRNKKSARLRALAKERELLNGQDPRRRRAPMLAAAVDEYMQNLESLGRASKTLDKSRHCFKQLLELAERRKVRRLDELDLRLIDAYRRERVAGGAKPKTLSNDLVTIKQLANFGVSRGMVAKNPLAGLKLKKPPRTPQPFWTSGQVRDILAAAKPPYRELYQLLAETGLRIGEAIWLTWDDVDFQNNVLHIRAKEDWRPKTGDRRVVPMSPAVRKLLRTLPRNYDWVFTARPSRKCPREGRQISDRRALAHLKTVLRRVQLPGHLHTFRHTFISRALTSGTAEAIVRQWVGHVDDEVLRWYTHVADQISQNAMSQLFAEDTDDEGEQP